MRKNFQNGRGSSGESQDCYFWISKLVKKLSLSSVSLLVFCSFVFISHIETTK